MPNIENLPVFIFLLLGSVVVGLGLWYLAVRRGDKRFKLMAAGVIAFPLIGIGFQIAFSAMGLANAPVYRTVLTLGSPRDSASSNDVAFEVNDPGPEHQVEMTPKVWGGDVPSKPVKLHFTVHSPRGEILADGDHDFDPTSNPRWATWDLEFKAHESGEHKLTLVVPGQVGRVDITIRELR